MISLLISWCHLHLDLLMAWFTSVAFHRLCSRSNFGAEVEILPHDLLRQRYKMNMLTKPKRDSHQVNTSPYHIIIISSPTNHYLLITISSPNNNHLITINHLNFHLNVQRFSRPKDLWPDPVEVLPVAGGMQPRAAQGTAQGLPRAEHRQRAELRLDDAGHGDEAEKHHGNGAQNHVPLQKIHRGCIWGCSRGCKYQ